MKRLATLFLALASCAAPQANAPAAAPQPTPQAEADQFLSLYSELYRSAYTASQDAQWKASTDVTPEHEGEAEGAQNAYAAIVGNPKVIETEKRLLAQKDRLDQLTFRELTFALLDSAEMPGVVPEVVARRVAAEVRTAGIMNSFVFCMDRPLPKAGEKCRKPITPNGIDKLLRDSRDPKERLLVWETSKESGPALMPGLLELRDLRNAVAQAMGYSSYFALETASYGMTPDEMMKLLDGWTAQVQPLQDRLACWAKEKLAARYHLPVPDGPIPAQWIGNRWAQSWPGIVAGVDLDALLAGKTPDWIIHTAEDFYVGLGFPRLSRAFWKESDLWALPAGAARKKNTHASAWHMDLEQDIRSLQSIEPDFEWFETAHHELGHVYYFMSYTRPEVPVILRRGANPGFHEGVGELISLEASQEPYLRELGLLKPGQKLDETAYLLDRALDDAITFIPFAAGTMSHFEYDLYEKRIPASQLDADWWGYAAKYQRVAPPMKREGGCDACTKTHIIDNPAYYYSYAFARALTYMLHDHICREILHVDPHACSYRGSKAVGDFLRSILAKGATEDWRKVLKEATGKELTLQPLVDYFAPLDKVLPPAGSCKL